MRGGALEVLMHQIGMFDRKGARPGNSPVARNALGRPRNFRRNAHEPCHERLSREPSDRLAANRLTARRASGQLMQCVL